jgi:transposase
LRRPAMHYIGMDVHSKVTMICILGEHGQVVREMKIPGSLKEMLVVLCRMRKELAGPIKVTYEASCGCGFLHDELVKMGMQVQVAHPGKLRLIFRSKRKNDRVDARKLATLLFLDQVPLAHVPAAEVRQWRSLIEYRSWMVGKRGALKNRIRAMLRNDGIVAPRGLWSRKGLAWLKGLELPPFEALQREMMVEELSLWQDRIKKVEAALKEYAAKVPGVGLLMTIPGVGIRTAEAVVAYIDDASRFRRNKSVGCYFGMVPCEDSSVKTRLGHITKDGPATVRRLITEAAWQSIRRSVSVRAFYERVRRDDAKRRNIALVATGHHLIRVMQAMLRTGEVWRETVEETAAVAQKVPA